jgi:hypothetical protein
LSPGEYQQAGVAHTVRLWPTSFYPWPRACAFIPHTRPQAAGTFPQFLAHGDEELPGKEKKERKKRKKKKGTSRTSYFIPGQRRRQKTGSPDDAQTIIRELCYLLGSMVSSHASSGFVATCHRGGLTNERARHPGKTFCPTPLLLVVEAPPLGALILVPLCLAVPFIYLNLSSDQKLREAIAEADRLDPSWRIPELEGRRTVIPDEENSALLLMAAVRLMPANWPFWYYSHAPEHRNRPKSELESLSKDFRELPPPVQLNERLINALREELQRADKALAMLRKVANMPRGRLPSTQSVWGVVDLLSSDVLLRAQEQDMDAALASCRGILNCGRSIGDEPTTRIMQDRISLNRVAIDKLERTLAQGTPSATALSSMQHELEEEAEQPLLLIMARAIRGNDDTAVQAVQAGDLGGSYGFVKAVTGDASESDVLGRLRIRSMAKSIRAGLLKYNNRFVEIAKLPVEQQVSRIKELAADPEFPQLARRTRELSVFHHNQAALRCTVVMVAIERYRRAKKRWPDMLTDLVPAYLSNVPLDPFDGAPIRYRPLNDGVAIYSVGLDGNDDGGKLDRNPMKQGTDLGVRLWDVSQRRQLPSR